MIVWLSALSAALALVAAAPTAVDEKLEIYSRPQQLVQLDAGRNVHLFCMGSGSPTVVLTAGLAHWALHWRKVQPEVAQFTRVCSWDRPGHGFSDPFPEPLTVKSSTRALERALQRGRVPDPYILVGHSVGAFETQLFAFRHPSKVAGILLLDPSAPHQAQRLARAAPKVNADSMAGLTGWLEQMERCATTGRECPEPPPNFGPLLTGAMNKQIRNVAAVRNIRSFSADAFSQGSDLLVKHRKPLAGVPILVLSAVEDESAPAGLEQEVLAAKTEWRKMHEEIAQLSTVGERREVQSPHNLHLAKPDVVVAAIRQVVEQVRLSKKR